MTITYEDKFIKQTAMIMGARLTPGRLKAMRQCLAAYRRIDRSEKGLPLISDEELLRLVIQICAEQEIDPGRLRMPYKKKAPTRVVEVRKEITKRIYGSYRITFQRLAAAIGGVHHSTMIYYYYGYKPSDYISRRIV